MHEESKDLWTLAEFAEWMRITLSAARGIIRRRELPAHAVIKIGRRVRIHPPAVREWVFSGVKAT